MPEVHTTEPVAAVCGGDSVGEGKEGEGEGVLDSLMELTTYCSCARPRFLLCYLCPSPLPPRPLPPWRMSARIALSTRSLPSLLVAFLLTGDLFRPSPTSVIDASLSLSRSLLWNPPTILRSNTANRTGPQTMPECRFNKSLHHQIKLQPAWGGGHGSPFENISFWEEYILCEGEERLNRSGLRIPPLWRGGVEEIW